MIEEIKSNYIRDEINRKQSAIDTNEQCYICKKILNQQKVQPCDNVKNFIYTYKNNKYVVCRDCQFNVVIPEIKNK